MAGNRDRIGRNCEIVYDWSAFQEIRDSADEIVEDYAEQLVGRANAYPSPAPTKRYAWSRADQGGVFVYPDTPHAANSNAKHNTLVKLMGGGM